MGLVVLVDRSNRVRIEVSGPDRAKFLHNLTTNDIKKLTAGKGKEAFVTTPQGKTLGFVTIHADETSMLVRSDPGTEGALLAHLNKYSIFDDVSCTDISDDTFELHAIGDPPIAGLDAPAIELGMASTAIDDVSVRVIRESPAGAAGFSIIGPAMARLRILERLYGAASTEVRELSEAEFEAMRIAAGTPMFGKEITPDNLPQELDRDARAISFVKGCYLGQETVARLDALGHVNKILRRVEFPTLKEAPPPQTECETGGKSAGVITSAAISQAGGVIALAYLKSAHASPGQSVVVNVADRMHEGSVSALEKK